MTDPLRAALSGDSKDLHAPTTTPDPLRAALENLFPAVQRARWPFTVEQAAAALRAALVADTFTARSDGLLSGRLAERRNEDHPRLAGEPSEGRATEAGLDVPSDGVQPMGSVGLIEGGQVDDHLDVGPKGRERSSGHADTIQQVVSNVNAWDHNDECRWCRNEIEDGHRADCAALAATAERPRHSDGCTCEPEHVWPCALIPRCDEPGCERETSWGWPSPTGYRRTCGEHYRAARLTENQP